MDIKVIKLLTELFDKYSLSELDYSEGDSKISLKRNNQTYETKPMIKEIPDQVIINEPVYTFSDINEMKSPLVGVFYSAPAPDSKPFVTIGSKVKKGDILCIVEAMKLINEIPSEFDGEIVDICVENGQIVEFGQTLFKII